MEISPPRIHFQNEFTIIHSNEDVALHFSSLLIGIEIFKATDLLLSHPSFRRSVGRSVVAAAAAREAFY